MAGDADRHGGNRLLGTLDEATFATLAPALERVSLDLKQTIYEPGKPIDYIYFPINCVLSMLARADKNVIVEVATIGNEGMVGLPLFLEAEQSPVILISQVPGQSLRMTAQAFETAIARASPFVRLLHRYTQALMIQIAQGSACNRVHSIEQRCARWLLLTHDRVGSDQFTLTQEFLGDMLGVRRMSVNVVGSIFQKAGFIRYSRGRITVLNRSGLESAVCHCYAVIRDAYERLLQERPANKSRRKPP